MEGVHNSKPTKTIHLQVLICTYGKEGIERVAEINHPRVDGVEYLVSWQTDGKYKTPETLHRNDFTIVTSNTKGISINRNVAISHATAPLILISDDDVVYSEDGLTEVIKGFQAHPEADIIAFKYESSNSNKYYPATPVDLDSPPKGYFVSSIEIAFRKDAVKGRVRFNENFGIGATFPYGEEDIFLRDCHDTGLKGIFLPVTIARHDGTTTTGRNMMLPSRPQTKGAVFLRLHPHDWPLRMIAHAIREIPLWKKGLTPSPFSYCYNWIKGTIMAKKRRVFQLPTSQKNQNNE